MKFKEYTGKIIRLKYPNFLRVAYAEPGWYATAKDRAGVNITINPPRVIAESFSRAIRQKSNANHLRKGEIQMHNGIRGFEEVTMHNESVVWKIDAKSDMGCVIHVRIWSSNDDWHDGTIWRDLIESIEIVGDPTTQKLTSNFDKRKTKYIAVQRKLKLAGVLKELPADLHYLLRIAQHVTSLDVEHLEESAEAMSLFENGLKDATRNLSKQKAVAHLKADGKELLAWLGQYSVEEHSEIAPLYVMISPCFNADKILK